MKTLIVTFGFFMLTTALASAQNVEPHYRGQGYVYYGFGTGFGNTPDHPMVNQIGFGGEGFLFGGVGFGGEAGYASWGQWRKVWIGSADGSYHFRRRATQGQVDPFMVCGFSIFGPTEAGNGRGAPAVNFGGGVNVWLWKHAALRFEARDHGGGGDFNPGDHYLSFRVGVTFR